MKHLALVFLLSSFSSLTLTEVVDSFEESCRSFFVQNQNHIIIPTVFTGHQYKKICQRWKNIYRFATVYDTVKRIPVYSAYTFLKKGETKRNNNWKVEPQLEKYSKEMIDIPRKSYQIVSNVENQAVNLDYTNSSYTRGHVFPKLYAADQDQADSTFTLTNIAPQTEDSNGQWEAQVETPMLNNITDICKLDQNHLAYVVTGVVPGNTWINITRPEESIENGINVPSHFWSAFCCTSKSDTKKLVFKAYLAKLDNFTLQTPDIASLNEQLTCLYGRNFAVFPGLYEESRDLCNLNLI